MLLFLAMMACDTSTEDPAQIAYAGIMDLTVDCIDAFDSLDDLDASLIVNWEYCHNSGDCTLNNDAVTIHPSSEGKARVYCPAGPFGDGEVTIRYLTPR